ncbi:MAG: hypothetical protein ABWY11_10575 [Umezawaea sp.]
MAIPAVRFPYQYRPVAGTASVVIVFAWIAVVASAVYAVGSWNWARWMVSGPPDLSDSDGPGWFAAVLGLLFCRVAWFVMAIGFFVWFRRVQWNARLVVGQEWGRRRKALSMTEVWNASDPVQRSRAEADRPKNPAFAVWVLGYVVLQLANASVGYLDRQSTEETAMEFTAYPAAVHLVIAVVFAVVTTLSVRAITRRQTTPAFFGWPRV